MTLEQRWKTHLADSKRLRCNRRPLYESINKHGENNFEIKLIEVCDDALGCDREVFWIGRYDTFNNGYNATLGGEGRAFLDWDLVIDTYEKEQNITKVSRMLNIDNSGIRKMFKQLGVKTIPTEIANVLNFGKGVNMYSLENELLKSFDSLAEAGRYVYENKSSRCKTHHNTIHIKQVCDGERKTAYKYKWKWSE